MLLEILYIIFGISAFGLFWTYAGYPIFIWFLSKIIKKEHKYDENYQPNVSLMIMSYNEEKTIEKKIKNTLEENYPKEKLQIMVVDSASTDKTREIVEKYSDKGIELVKQEERRGEASAMNYGLKYAIGDVIISTDANSYFNKDAIKHLVKHFSDPNVGIVGGKFFVKKIKSTSETEGTDFFRKYEEFLREKESKIDSAVNFGGEIYGIQKHLAIFDEESIAEDFDICVSVRKKGYRLLHEPLSEAYEYAPSIKEDVLLQRKKVFIGMIQTLVKYKRVLFNPRYGVYGVIILPGHRLFQVLNPLFLIGIMVSSVGVYFYIDSTLFFCLVIGMFIYLIVSIITMRIKNIKFLPIMGIKYFMEVQMSCLSAYMSYIKGEHKTNLEKIKQKMKSSRV